MSYIIYGEEYESDNTTSESSSISVYMILSSNNIIIARKNCDVFLRKLRLNDIA